VVWNILDFAIVFTSMIDSWFVPVVELLKKELFPARRHPGRASTDLSLGQAMMLMRIMRLMRILRLVKVIKTVRPLYILVQCCERNSRRVLGASVDSCNPLWDGHLSHTYCGAWNASLS